MLSQEWPKFGIDGLSGCSGALPRNFRSLVVRRPADDDRDLYCDHVPVWRPSKGVRMQGNKPNGGNRGRKRVTSRGC